jgi:MscS family membrane protein
MYVIPNAVFSKNTVLNVTRKQREWRFYEFLCVRVQDVHKVNAIIQVRGCGRLLCMFVKCSVLVC